MAQRMPTNPTIESRDATTQLSALVRSVSHGRVRVVLADEGVPVAAIVSTDDLERLDQLDRERDADFAVVDELRAAWADVPVEEIERETDRILAINQDDDGA